MKHKGGGEEKKNLPCIEDHWMIPKEIMPNKLGWTD